MKQNKLLFPQLFKGIALFTPGGDLIYSIDPSKQSHWHMHLCAALQEMLGLVEPPHFLVPGYTATIDRWLNPQTRQIRTSAEIYPPVQHHQALLNAVYGTGDLTWNVAPWQEGFCDPIVLETYRHQFPQLWEDHDLIVRFERPEGLSQSSSFNESYYSLQETIREKVVPTQQEQLSLERSYPVGATARTQKRKEGASGMKQCYPMSVSFSISDNVLTGQDSLQGKRQTQIQKISCGRDEFTTPNVADTNSEKVDELSKFDCAGNCNVNTTDTKEFADQAPKHSYDDYETMDSRSYSLDTQGYVLRLFVSGNSAATEQTLKSLHQLLEHALRHPYTLKVIDIFNHPDQAEENHISATPTLLRVWPLPVRRIVGDLNDVEKVLRILAAPQA